MLFITQNFHSRSIRNILPNVTALIFCSNASRVPVAAWPTMRSRPAVAAPQWATPPTTGAWGSTPLTTGAWGSTPPTTGARGSTPPTTGAWGSTPPTTGARGSTPPTTGAWGSTPPTTGPGAWGSIHSTIRIRCAPAGYPALTETHQARKSAEEKKKRLQCHGISGH
jgi:hypothetical protein